MTYWIEVDFENGKTLKKDTLNLNEAYAVYCRYKHNTNRRMKVLDVRTGKNKRP